MTYRGNGARILGIGVILSGQDEMLAGGLSGVAARDVAFAPLDDDDQTAAFSGVALDGVGADGGEGFGFHARANLVVETASSGVLPWLSRQ